MVSPAGREADVVEGHRCFMQSVPLKPVINAELGDTTVVCFDFESYAADMHVVSECHWKNNHTDEQNFPHQGDEILWQLQ